jgi:peptide/nickel transport system permease protein
MTTKRAERSLSLVRLLIAVLVGLAALMLLAAVPDIWHRDIDGVLTFDLSTVPENISAYVRGVFNGDSWRFRETWYERSFMSTMWPRTVRSLFYLLTSGLAATAVGLALGAWLTASRRDRLREIITFAGAVPDFVLALLLQIGVVAVYKSTGVRIARVASLTNAEPALLLPLIALIVVPAVYLLRTVSARAYVVAAEDYVLVAKATGIGRLRIWVSQIMPNLTAFVRADLAKICGMMIANFFIVEYLFSLKGVTALVFSFGISYSYQYALVMNSFLLMILMYAIMYATLRLFIRLVDEVATRL